MQLTMRDINSKTEEFILKTLRDYLIKWTLVLLLVLWSWSRFPDLVQCYYCSYFEINLLFFMKWYCKKLFFISQWHHIIELNSWQASNMLKKEDLTFDYVRKRNSYFSIAFFKVLFWFDIKLQCTKYFCTIFSLFWSTLNKVI